MLQQLPVSFQTKQKQSVFLLRFTCCTS